MEFFLSTCQIFAFKLKKKVLQLFFRMKFASE